MRASQGSQAPQQDRTKSKSGRGLGRRRFLQTSAAALSALGVGLTTTVGTATAQAESVPEYADFIPVSDPLTLANGEVGFSSADVDALFELVNTDVEGQEQQNTSETTPLQFEPQTLALFAAGATFALYDELGLAPAIVGGPLPESGGIAPEDVSDSPTDRVTAIETPLNRGASVSISTGSYDTGAVAAAVSETDLTESNVSGIFVGSDPRFGGTQQDQELAVTWSSNYVISGPTVDLVQTVEAAALGQNPRLWEENDDLARQLSTAGTGDFTATTYSRAGELTVSNASNFFDINFTPIENGRIQGYTQSFAYDFDNATASAISTFSHPSTSAVDEGVFSTVAASAVDRSISTEGRYVTIQARYDFPSLDSTDDTDGSEDGTDGSDETDDSDSEDGTDGSDETDNSDSDGGSDGSDGMDGSDGSDGDGGSDEDGMDGSDGSDGDGGSDEDGMDSSDGSDGDDGSDEDGMDGSDGSDGDDGSDGSDDSGPGFGILSAATGIGGAGYLLKQRLGNPDETE